ncbi:hypothetical protein PAMP_016269 [Pampus punctatissimus]
MTKLILQTSPPPCQLFISGKHLAKVAARRRSLEITCQKAEPHFDILLKKKKKGNNVFSFAISQAAQNATQWPFICFGAGLNSLFRRSGGIVCAQIFACGWDRQREDGAQC